ncbi:unnamed protein product, partial [Bubo scandiacus]
RSITATCSSQVLSLICLAVTSYRKVKAMNLKYFWLRKVKNCTSNLKTKSLYCLWKLGNPFQ